MKIYISGPITGTKDYMERFAAAEREMKECGHEVINPAKLSIIMPESTTWEQYMVISLDLLKMCDGICMLEGWEKSKGASMEHLYALMYKMDIYIIGGVK